MTFCSKSLRSFPALPSSNNIGTFESLVSHHPAHLAAAAAKTDPLRMGFVDQIGDDCGGRMTLCTESLGFESLDERGMDDPNQDKTNGGDMGLRAAAAEAVFGSRSKRAAARAETEGKRFPPPLSSLGGNGRPTFFLRPVTKDGRLELTQVKIDRPEILRASRQDGRLRLHVIEKEDPADAEEKTETEEAEEGEEAEGSADWWVPARGGGECFKTKRTTVSAATSVACIRGVSVV